MEVWITQLLGWLALPQFGLSTVFVVALLSATLLPLGSEPAVVGLLQLNPELFWPTIFVATAGNTLGGAISWWMGLGAHKAWHAARARRRAGQPEQSKPPRALSRNERRARIWLRRLGPKACLLSWLPIVGDPLCAVAGWLRMPFWACVFYMAIGKFARYLVMTTVLLQLLPASWKF
ncbi:YqaA family protein [Comamonas composti]|uniref:YqaA family protein n=1 Tax=Comamonas composti TaxID=408558 RepID=UPI0004229762|nr:YqaA family protein [Comamonas composti]